MKRFLFALIFLLSATVQISAQSYLEWESNSIEEFYEKIELEAGTLDEDGESIDHVYVTTELEEGVYEVEIADHKGDLYKINYTGYYFTFQWLYGLAGLGEEGILVVGKSGWSSTFYKKPY